MSRRCVFAWLLLLGSGLAPSLDAGVPLPAGVERGPSVEGISEYRLANGLRVLVFPDESKPTVTVNITYLVGSRHEPYGSTGMAHLLEHLLFKGTPSVPDIPGEMRRRGIRFNATTWLDRTNYFGSFAGAGDHLDWLLALEADRMINANVSREHLDSEMTVVRNEMEAGENNPLRALIDRVTSTAFVWHNYGNSTIGARSDVENMPIGALQAFYRQHYRPDNAVLLVAGRVDEADVLSRVAMHFGTLALPPTPLPETYTREPPQDGERSVTVRRAGETPYLAVSYHVPAGTHPDAAALQVLAEALANEPNGRLHRALVESGMASFVADFAPALAEPGFLMFYSQLPADASVERVREHLVDELEPTTRPPFSAEERDDAVRALLTGIDATLHDANRLAMALSEAIALGDWRMFFLMRDRIEAVTPGDLDRVAAAYLRPSNRTLGTFVPTDTHDRVRIDEAPGAGEVLDGYSGRPAIAAGEAFDPDPVTIDARTELRTLSNGTRLALLPKRTRGGTVHLSMRLLFGTEASVRGHVEAGEYSAAMLDRGGAGLTRSQIARKLDALDARLSFGGGAQGVSVGLSTRREHFDEAFELVTRLLKDPAFPADEFEQLRGQSISAVQARRNDPSAVARRALARHFNVFAKDHPLYIADFDEEIAALRALRLEDVQAFHARFYGAGTGEIAVVGDFDAEDFASSAQTLLGGWTSTEPFERIANPHVPVEPKDLHIDVADKPNAMLFLGARLAMSDSDPAYPALLLGTQILGGGALKSRLADRIRQRDGLSYGVGAHFSASPLDDNAGITIYALSAPENLARVRQAIEEELARLLSDGIEEEELRDAADGLLQVQRMHRAEDVQLAGLLRGNLYLGRTMQWIAELEERIASLGVAEVEQALREHFAAARFSSFSAGEPDAASR